MAAKRKPENLSFSSGSARKCPLDKVESLYIIGFA
jgi:hypothetical protein